MHAIKTFLILSHRYIGIPLSFFFVMWFVSGYFMIYTGGMPKVTADMQVDGEEPLDFAKVVITPAQAMEKAGNDEPPSAMLRTILGRPVYELGDPGYNSNYVYADSGELMPELTPEQGAELAGRFLDIPAGKFRWQQTLDDQVDQWTLTVKRELPLYKYTVDDELGTEVYVSKSANKVSAYTTRKSRMYAWLGTIPHWLYFKDLRANQPLWYSIVVWSSGIGCVAALLGLLLGITQFRKVRPFQLSKAIPYRALMRWHYILGCVFGVVTLTWMFSGLVSMEPWEWTNARGVRVRPDTLTGGELKLGEFTAPASVDWQALTAYPVKQVEFARVLAAPYWVADFTPVHESVGGKRDRLHQPYNINGQLRSASIMVDAASGKLHEGFDIKVLATELDNAIGDATITETALLTDYDDYYYSRGNQLPLPVLRAKFDDPNQSWVYIDPQRGQLLSVVHKWSRLERWLYNGLHSLDFAFWYHKRPLWDIGVLVLLTGGLATSLIGLWFGLRRLKQDIVTVLNKVARKKPAGELSHVA